jgi:hypothetical protein
MVVLAHLWRRWSLSGREGFGFLSAGFSAFCGSVTPIFYCARGEETVVKVRSVYLWKTLNGRWTRCGPGWTYMSGQFKPQADTRARGSQTGVSGPSRHQRVWSCTQESSTKGRCERMRWRVRSRATGHVRSREELSELRSDTGCSASGQMVKRVRSWQRLSLTALLLLVWPVLPVIMIFTVTSCNG